MEQSVEQFDFVIIGAGSAGEAAAQLACRRGATVAVVERDLFGGSCPFWACMPSKTLLHGASIHHLGGDYPWSQASDRRDYMINREGSDYPDDAGHVKSLEKAGAVAIRGEARIVGPGRVEVHDGRLRTLQGRSLIVAVGSHSRIPPIEGLDADDIWTNRQGTATRELPRSLVILGGGPTGVELAQVYARYGVPTTIIDSNERLLSRDHPRNSAAVTEALEKDGVTVLTGVRAVRLQQGLGADGTRSVELSDGSCVEGHETLVAVGRAFPLDALGLESIDVQVDDKGGVQPDERLRIAPDVYLVGDPAGPEMHTHLAHYQGEMAVRIALGEDVQPDYRAIPRATYTDPETASVGLRLDEALEAGHDALEETQDLAETAKGYVAEASGHVTVVVDRRDRVLLGAFICGPGASEAIHEAVLAIKLRVPLAVLADTIHAFPTVSRVMGSLFAKVARDLE